jgi:hypothetical protein
MSSSSEEEPIYSSASSARRAINQTPSCQDPQNFSKMRGVSNPEALVEAENDVWLRRKLTLTSQLNQVQMPSGGSGRNQGRPSDLSKVDTSTIPPIKTFFKPKTPKIPIFDYSSSSSSSDTDKSDGPNQSSPAESDQIDLEEEEEEMDDWGEFNSFNSQFDELMGEDAAMADVEIPMEEMERLVGGDNLVPHLSIIREYLDSVRDRIKLSNRDLVPSRRLYTKGVNWIYPKNDHFSLGNQLPSSLDPSSFYYPDVMYFNPLHVGERPKCCNESCKNRKELVMSGFPSNPCARRCIGIDRVYYIMAHVLSCPSCNKTYYSTAPCIMEQYSLHIRDSFPALLTNCTALDLKVSLLSLRI